MPRSFLYPRKEPQVSIGYEAEWDFRAGLDDVERRKFLSLPGFELPTLGRPAHSQTLYK
jgi:hypothetical protein